MRFGIGALYAVQAFDALQENYNPEFVAFLNDLLYNDPSKDRYMIAEAEAVTTLTRNPVGVVPNINQYHVQTLDELRYFNGLTKLPERMNAGVSSVIYPDSITIVGDQAWLSRPMLKYFEIGNAVTKIQKYLFQTSTAPTTYVCRTPIPPAYNAAGYSTAQRAICDLFVPAESIALYQQASVWNEFKSINAIDPSKKKQSL
jgi:hypothetical protein